MLLLWVNFEPCQQYHFWAVKQAVAQYLLQQLYRNYTVFFPQSGLMIFAQAGSAWVRFLDGIFPHDLHVDSISFPLQLNFVRFYLPLLVKRHKRIIYLDDDVIVQGKETSLW